METFTIAAATWQSACDLCQVLSRFRADLLETEDGRQQVVVRLGGDREIVEVLNALEVYVTERNRGPAQIRWHDHEYMLYPRAGEAPRTP